jgi:two-component system, OmpR family, response regulator
VRILVIEDDAALVRLLQRGLVEEGHAVELAQSGPVGLERLLDTDATRLLDACVLDIQLPGLDGLSVLGRARDRGVATPVLILTARDAIPDRVQGLRTGADDYLTKPFAFAELLARLEVIGRRAQPRTSLVTSGDLSLDAARHHATLAGAPLTLSEKQFALLEFFLRHAGRVVTRAMVLKSVFGYGFEPGTNIVDVHVGHLRQRIDTPGRRSRITTVRGVGYRLETDG